MTFEQKHEEEIIWLIKDMFLLNYNNQCKKSGKYLVQTRNAVKTENDEAINIFGRTVEQIYRKSEKEVFN